MSPSTNSDAGLAHVDDSDDTPVVMPLDIRKSSALSSTNKVKFPIVEGGQHQREDSFYVNNFKLVSSLREHVGDVSDAYAMLRARLKSDSAQ